MAASKKVRKGLRSKMVDSFPYWDRLTPEAQEWCQKFVNAEDVAYRRTVAPDYTPTGEKPELSAYDKQEINKIWRTQNARRADLFTRDRASRLEPRVISEAYQAWREQASAWYLTEDDIIAKIDGSKPGLRMWAFLRMFKSNNE